MRVNKVLKNDYIGVVSLSGFFKEKNEKDVLESIDNAKKISLNVKLGDSVYETKENKPSIEDKLCDLNKMLEDNEVKIIIASKGGSSSIFLLDKIDYEKIKKTRKIIIGLSDLTILLNAIYQQTNLITFHHTIFKAFLKGDTTYNKKAFCDMFYLKKKDYQFVKNFKTLTEGSVEGTLLGGNLISFHQLMKTNYLPKDNDIIYFFEECDEVGKEEVEYLLDDMMENHLFDCCRGIILGNYSIDNDYFEAIFKKKFKNIPMIKCLDFGHTECNMVMPIGARILFDANNGRMKILSDLFN